MSSALSVTGTTPRPLQSSQTSKTDHRNSCSALARVSRDLILCEPIMKAYQTCDLPSNVWFELPRPPDPNGTDSDGDNSVRARGKYDMSAHLIDTDTKYFVAYSLKRAMRGPTAIPMRLIKSVQSFAFAGARSEEFVVIVADAILSTLSSLNVNMCSACGIWICHSCGTLQFPKHWLHAYRELHVMRLMKWEKAWLINKWFMDEGSVSDPTQIPSVAFRNPSSFETATRAAEYSPQMLRLTDKAEVIFEEFPLCADGMWLWKRLRLWLRLKALSPHPSF